MDFEVSTSPVLHGYTPVVRIGGKEIWRDGTAYGNKGEAAAAGRKKVIEVLSKLFEGAS